MTVEQLVKRFDELEQKWATSDRATRKNIEKTQSTIQYLLNKKLGIK